MMAVSERSLNNLALGDGKEGGREGRTDRFKDEEEERQHGDAGLDKVSLDRQPY